MTKAVATRGETLPATGDAMIAAMRAGMTNMQEAAANDSGGLLFMGFTKGDYTYGPDDTELEEGSEWAINPNSFVHGYQCWGNGKLLGEHVASMGEKPLVKTALEKVVYEDKKLKVDVTAKWEPFRGFQLVCTNGEDEGVTCYLSGASRGFSDGVRDLIGEIMEHMKEDPSSPVPIVELTEDGYEHKSWGWVATPFFKVLEWADLDAIAVEMPEGDEDEPAESDGAREPDEILDPEDAGTDEDEETEEEEEARLAEEEAEDLAKAEAAQAAAKAKPARRGRAKPAADAKPKRGRAAPKEDENEVEKPKRGGARKSSRKKAGAKASASEGPVRRRVRRRGPSSE